MYIFKKNEGLTLVELLVVIALVGVVGGIAFPVFSNLMAAAQADANSASVEAVANFTKEYANFNLTQSGSDIIASTGSGVEIARIAGTLSGGGGGGGGTNGPVIPTLPNPGDTTTSSGLLQANGAPIQVTILDAKYYVQPGLYAAGGRVFTIDSFALRSGSLYTLGQTGLTQSDLNSALTRVTSDTSTKDNLGYPYIGPGVTYTLNNVLDVYLPTVKLMPSNQWQAHNDGKVWLTINNETIQIGNWSIGQ